MGMMESLLPALLKSMAPEVQQNLQNVIATVQHFDARFKAIENRLDRMEAQANLTNALLQRVLDILESAEDVEIIPPPLSS